MKSTWRSGGRSRARLLVFALLAAGLLLASFLPSLGVPYDPYVQDLSMALQPPDGAHWLGTDRYGRDLLARVLLGGQTSIPAALAAAALAAVTGSLLGAAAGWRGGWPETAVLRLADLALAVPGLVLAMALAAAMNGGTFAAVGALALAGWPKYARLARSLTLAVRESDFLAAARLSGGGTAYLLRRHVLPNIFGPLAVTAALDTGTMMMELAALSFLGLGAAPPAAEWGAMISEGRSLLQTCPWMVAGPGAAVAVTVTVWNLLGDAARDAMDVRGRARQGREAS